MSTISLRLSMKLSMAIGANGVVSLSWRERRMHAGRNPAVGVDAAVRADWGGRVLDVENGVGVGEAALVGGGCAGADAA